jgi:polysaccharide biosynthesis protein PslE
MKVFSLRDLAHVLFKRKKQILWFFFAIVGAVVVVTLKSTPIYEARSHILVKIGRENVYVPTVASSASQNMIVSLDREEQINSEIEILNSPALIEKVAETVGPVVVYPDLKENSSWLKESLSRLSLGHRKRKLSILEEAVARLKGDLSIAAVKKSNVIEVRLRSESPEIAALVLNEFVRLYTSQHVDVYKTPQSYNFFQEQSEMLRRKLKGAEDRLEAFKKENKVTLLDEERRLLLSQDSALKHDMNSTLSQVAETESRIEQIRRQLAATPQTVHTGEEVERIPAVIGTLQARLMDLEVKEKELLTKYTEQSRLVENVREEMKIVRAKLAEQESRQYGRSVSGLNTTYQRLEEDLYRSQAELKALKAKEETQALHLAEYRVRLEKLNRVAHELSTLEREVDVEQQNYKLYLIRLEEARISDAMDIEKIANVKQLDPARPPLKPVSPKVVLNLAIGLFLGVLGSLGAAFLMENLDDRIEKSEDAEKLLQLPVLASIPELRS